MTIVVREADQCAVDRAYTFRDELLRRSASGALASVSALAGGAKLIAGATTSLARLEYHQVSIDEIFRGDARRGVLHKTNLKNSGVHRSMSVATKGFVVELAD